MYSCKLTNFDKDIHHGISIALHHKIYKYATINTGITALQAKRNSELKAFLPHSL